MKLIFKFSAIFLVVGLCNSAMAFEYHEIKSGMTFEEVTEITGCKKDCGSKRSTHPVQIITHHDFKPLFGEEENVPHYLSRIALQFTSDYKLFHLELRFWKAAEGPEAAAQKKVLNELYPDTPLIETSEQRPGGYTMEYITAKIIDKALFQQDVEKIYEETKNKY